MPPLFVIEILHRALDVFEDYFNECSEAALKENFVIVYEVIIIFLLEKSISVNRLIIIKTNWKLLDEMLDNGFPLATEVSVLKELIKPPNLYRKVHNLVTGDTKYDIPIFRGTDTSLVDLLCCFLV